MANIDLITGFLGAGKTTYIKKYCEFLKERGESFAVIENEYGNKGIDAALLNENGIETTELSGGCICCTLKIGFHDMIDSLAEKYDRIIVEPSGVYDITQFYYVMNSPVLKSKATIGNIICIVDPYSIEELDDFSIDMLRRQVMLSSAVVFSMSENFVKAELDDFEKRLKKRLNLDNIKYISYNDFEKAIFLPVPILTEAVNSELTHSSRYMSTLIKTIQQSKENLCANIEELFRSENCGAVLRVKGITSGYLVNAVRNNISIEKTLKPDEGLNVIGLTLRRSKIKSILNRG